MVELTAALVVERTAALVVVLAAALAAAGPGLGLPLASRPVAARAATPSVRPESRIARVDLSACTTDPLSITAPSGTTGTAALWWNVSAALTCSRITTICQ